jgi:hypothetical protein
MKIGLITTLGTNLGDDLIRAGICHILKEVFSGQKIEFACVNKHKPYTVYPPWHPLRWAPRGQRILRRVLPKYGLSIFDRCDCIVQCGTPVIWPGCHKCEWAVPVWHEVVGRLSQKGIPVFNLGAGSCYPWKKQPESVTDEEDRAYLQKILGYCKITTVRDVLAHTLLKNLGYESPFIPCPALVAGRPYAGKPADDGFVVINYMEKGGHYDWEQNIDAAIWSASVVKLVQHIRKRHKVVFLCHDLKEHALASRMDPSIPCFLPKNLDQYFSFLAHAKAGICNRLHASVALAGIGIPTVAVGTDTRMKMVEAIGLPSFYVKDAFQEKVTDAFENIMNRRKSEYERLIALRERTWNQYVNIVKTCIASKE